MKIISKNFCIFVWLDTGLKFGKRKQTSFFFSRLDHINIWINCCCRHSSSSSSSIIFFFRDEELGWMDDGTDDGTDGWKGRPQADKTKDIIYEDNNNNNASDVFIASRTWFQQSKCASKCSWIIMHCGIVKPLSIMLCKVPGAPLTLRSSFLLLLLFLKEGHVQ